MVRVLDDNVTATLFPGRQVNLLQYHLGRRAECVSASSSEEELGPEPEWLPSVRGLAGLTPPRANNHQKVPEHCSTSLPEYI